MKNNIKIVGAGLLILTVVVSYKVTNAVAQTPPPTGGSFCQTNGPYGNNAYVSSSTYQKGETVSFCLRDNGRIPFFFGVDSHPWVILDSKDQVVFQPKSIPPTSQPQASFVFFDTWNQHDNSGKQVPKGTYKVLFTGTIYTVQPVSFTIVPSAEDRDGNHDNDKDNGKNGGHDGNNWNDRNGSNDRNDRNGNNKNDRNGK